MLHMCRWRESEGGGKVKDENVCENSFRGMKSYSRAFVYTSS